VEDFMPNGEDNINRGTEVFKSGVTGEVRTGSVPRLTLPPAIVDYEVIDGQAIFEGDIILGTAEQLAGEAGAAQPLTEGVAITGDKFRWTNGVVPFRIDAGLPNQARVTGAIQHWEQNTTINFVAHTNQGDFVTFRSGDGCSSSVGRQGGEQFVNLGAGCSTGSTIHEIGHTVGLWHEQSREDRNNFITINWDNIQDGKEHNFNQHISDGDDIGAYDYGSIMHYGAFGFAKDPNVPTIVSPQPIGQRNALSAGDLAAIRYLYYFRRRGDSADLAGAVSEIAVVRHETQQLVTAVRTASNTLKLISWRVNANGSIARTGDSGDAAGAASQIDIAKARIYVTACRTASGNLKLISWNINAAGAISRDGDSGDAAGAATLNKIVALSDTLLLTACRTGEGTLKLISWRLNANGSITRLHDSGTAAGGVSEIDLVRITSGRAATAVRINEGTLKVIVWDVAAAGQISRQGDSGNQAGDARLIRVVRAATGHLITAVRAANGDLKLISWSVSGDGDTVTRRGDSGGQAGEIGDNALMSRAPGVLSAVRAADGDLKLIAWDVTAAGAIRRVGDSYNLAGEASLIAFCPESLTGGAAIVTAVRAANGTLKLISWDD
jgi:hypothetical protein